MYNAELKKKFILDTIVSIGYKTIVERAFNRTERYEAESNKDLCSFSVDEATVVLNDITGARDGSRSYTDAVRGYVKWCLDNGIDGASDGVLKANIDRSDKFRYKMVGSPKELQEYLDAVFRSADEEGIDSIYRAYFWLAFGGFRRDDAFKLKTADVNLAERYVRYGEYFMRINDDAYQAFKNCVVLDEFKIRRRLKDGKVVEHWRKRIPGNMLLRSVKDTEVKTTATLICHRTNWAVRDRLTDKRLTYEKVWLSGFYFRVLEKEIYGIDTENDFVWAVGEVSENDDEIYRSRKKNELKRDYRMWKSLFH